MSESVFNNGHFAHYHASLTFTGRLIGGSPSDPKLIEGWLSKNLGITDEDQLKQWTMRQLAEIHGIDPADATMEEIQAAVDENAAETKAQVFKRTAAGEPYVEPRHVKAMLKEAANIAYPAGSVKFGQHKSQSVKNAGKAVGGKSARDFIAERVFVKDEPIVAGAEITGVDLAVGHIKDGRTGEKRSTLGYFEFLEQPTIQVEVKALDDCLAEEQWARIWTVAELNGLGARRSQGAGQFVVTKWERDA